MIWKDRILCPPGLLLCGHFSVCLCGNVHAYNKYIIAVREVDAVEARSFFDEECEEGFPVFGAGTAPEMDRPSVIPKERMAAYYGRLQQEDTGFSRNPVLACRQPNTYNDIQNIETIHNIQEIADPQKESTT